MRLAPLRLWLPLTLAALSVATAGWSAGAPQATLQRSPYLQRATPDSMVVVWRTSGEIDPIVQFGPAPGDWEDEVGLEAIACVVSPHLDRDDGDRLHSAPADCFQWEAELAGLEPDTRYYYQVCDGDEVLAGGNEEHYFRTSPVAGADRSLRLWVVGDSGTGGAEQAAVFEAMQDHLADRGQTLDGFLHVGDMAYPNGTDREFTDHFFAPYASLLRHTVCWPTMGNHEGHTSDGNQAIGPYYDAYVVPTLGEAGGLESGTEAYYSFDLGPLHGVCLNSYDVDRSPRGAMARWLKADLEQTDARWLLAFWHHPPYTLGTHDSNRELELLEMRQHIMPILESAGVDLVLAGHSHIYERSMLIDGAYATPTVAEGVVLDDGDGHPDGDGAYRKSAGLHPHQGTIAVVTGNGGAGMGRRGTMPVMRSIHVEHGSVLLELEGNTLTVQMLSASGEVRDLCQLVKEGEVTPAPMAHPWQPLGPEVRVQRDPVTGTNSVTLVPRPAAPDAVVHYTLDGSLPLPSSPRHDEPLSLDRDVELQAISVWDGGRRISPVTTQEVDYLPPGSFVQTISAVENDVQFTVMDRSELPTELRLWGERSAATASFAGPHDLSQRPRTNASVAWSPAPWLVEGARGNEQRTPDLSAILQEVIDLPDWQPGSDVLIIVGGVGNRVAAAYDGYPPGAPTLYARSRVGGTR